MNIEWKTGVDFNELPHNRYVLFYLEELNTIFVGYRRLGTLYLYELEQKSDPTDYDAQIAHVSNFENHILDEAARERAIDELQKEKQKDLEDDVNFKKITTSILIMNEKHFKNYLNWQYIVLPYLNIDFASSRSI